MIGKRLGKWVSPLLLGAGLCTGPASAQIVVNDWTFNFGAVPGFGGFGELQHVNTLGFQGLFHSTTAAIPIVGTPVSTDFLANVNTANGAVGVTTTGKVLGSTSNAVGVEITATGQTNGNITVANPPNFESRFNTGFLNVFVGLPGGAPNGANGTADVDPTSPTRGTGMGGPTDPTDPNSVLIATFQLINDGTGNTFSSAIATGATKADFKLVTLFVPNALLDSGGNPLALGALLALADAQTNVDPNGNPPTTIGTFTIPVGPLGGTCGNVFNNVCGIENGNLRIATAVPEPGSLALLGATALAAGMLFGTRRRKP